MNRQSLQRTIKKRFPLFVGGLTLIVVVVVGLVVVLSPDRQPDQAAFCAHNKGIKQPTDREDDIKNLKELEKLAPDDIYPAVHRVREAWERAAKNPGGALAIELEVQGSTTELTSWVNQHCNEGR